MWTEYIVNNQLDNFHAAILREQSAVAKMIMDQSKEIFTDDWISMHAIARQVRSNSSQICSDFTDTMLQPKAGQYAYLNGLRSGNVSDGSK